MFLLIVLFFLLICICIGFSSFFIDSNKLEQNEEQESLKVKEETISQFLLNLRFISHQDNFDDWIALNSEKLNYIANYFEISVDELIKAISYNDDNFMFDDNLFSSSFLYGDNLFNDKMYQYGSHILINPTTGLPILNGSSIDVGGNVIGASSHEFDNNFGYSSMNNHFDHNSMNNDFDHNSMNNDFDHNSMNNHFDHNSMNNDFDHNSMNNHFDHSSNDDFKL